MSLEQQIGALVKASENLTGAVNGKIGEIDNRMDSAEAQFDEWRNKKDVLGNESIAGAMRMSIFQGQVIGTGGVQGVGGVGGFSNPDDLGTSSNVFLHFKTPLNVNRNSEMFWFNIRGYSYGTAKIIDETIVGYCYSVSRSLLNQNAFGNFTPASYADSNGNVILRIKCPALYFTTCRVDTMRVGNGRLFNLNDLKAKFSLSETVVF
ncbi:hypothetical protein UA38_21085 [Photobacterium kishitanii]|uniref:DUF1983 domain-containing protein n=1 Tax=Photobacterium kishitanii TaxID=318456 RepID=A0AAX0YUI6_9GAMM|nr:hypothetical protein [Photobacterium kishitanii]KJG55161.1 hypothetical protein UA38_21085 [Photobacterium kishitanii]KJG57455.1 hypothetical protein UA42_21265 [Photobacterium kishitanii]KJG63516.1 hypothetical protein UA40_21470 [Photobacterium kishitanii]KJG70674.1 hypothetical protein UA41_05620 [Photobacterium kishitanii]PSX20942.1 hypothetical protein C0W70_01530 [Photobacterium kishitanii]